jgi:polysaccharide biosynthesis protein PslG
MSADIKARESQMRVFIAGWVMVTFFLGLATFLAIYFTYRPAPGESGQPSVALTLGSGGAEAVVVLPSITAPPTTVATSTEPPATASPAALVAANVEDEPTQEPTTPPTPLPIDDRRFQLGIQVQSTISGDPAIQDSWFRPVADDLRLDWVKQQVRWEFIELQPGQFDWTTLDIVMDSARTHGLKIMASIVTAPDWARQPGVDLSRHGPPADPQTYVNFVTTLLNRYPGQIQAVEVWNEQNIDREWTSTGGLNEFDYVALLRPTYNAVKAIDPGIIVISGALSPTGFNDGIGAWDDFVYMDKLINAGMLESTDCVGVHHNGYNIGPSVRYDEVPNDPTAAFRGPFDNPHHSWSFRSTLEGYATRIAAVGSDIPLCVTEFGWAVTEDLDGTPAGFEFADDNTLEEQAKWLPEAADLMEEWGTVWLAFVWNFNYAPQAGWDPNNDNVPYSLIGPGYSFRPAYDAIRDWQRLRLTDGA